MELCQNFMCWLSASYVSIFLKSYLNYFLWNSATSYETKKSRKTKIAKSVVSLAFELSVVKYITEV